MATIQAYSPEKAEQFNAEKEIQVEGIMAEPHDELVEGISSVLWQLYQIHRRDPLKLGRLFVQQMGMEVDAEADLLAKEKRCD